MTTNLTYIKGDLLKSIPIPGEILWISEDLYDQITSKDDGLQFVKMQCNLPLQELNVFIKIEKVKMEQSGCYINPNFLPSGSAFSQESPVTISLLDLQNCSVAESLEIKLVEKEVLSWSEDEIDFAQTSFSINNRIVYLDQRVKMLTSVNKSVFGEVTKIYPKPSSTEMEVFRVTEKTLIHLDGLPQNRQKTIDFDKIGGLQKIISNLREIIQIPQVYPEIYNSFDIKPPKGLILYGPPGNGKTMIARAIAHSLGSKFVSIEGPELSSKFTGESEKKLRDKFDQVAKGGRGVLFIDEIDSLASIRTMDSSSEFQISMVASLLNLMDGLSSENGIFVIGATNRLGAVDPALRRPGRFELEFEIPLPDLSSRLDILQKSFPLENNELVKPDLNLAFLEHISQITHGYSGADLVSLYRLSVMHAISKKMQVDKETGKFNLVHPQEPIKLSKEDVVVTLKKITPTSLRGTNIMENKVVWEDLLGVETQKEYLNVLHQKVGLLEKSSVVHRPDFMNLIFLGSNGTGRKTLMRSFAQKFNYEWIGLDVTDFFSSSLEKTIQGLQERLQRARQLAPSVFYIENLGYFSAHSIFLIKLKAMLCELQSQGSVVVVIALEQDIALENLNGYQGFNEIVEFKKVLFSEIKEQLSKKYDLTKEIIQKFGACEQGIGIHITRIEESTLEIK